jgi:hypothetical protein
MHDTNDWAFHMDDASYSTNINVSTAMIIYAFNVDGAIGLNITRTFFPVTPPLAPLSTREGDIPRCSLW